MRARFVDVLDDLGGVVQFVRQHGGPEVRRIVRLQIGRLVGQITIRKTVGAIEGVIGEAFDAGPELFELDFVVAALDRLPQEFLFVLVQLFAFLLAHGAAHQVGFAKRITGEPLEDCHDLLLIDQHAERVAHHFLQLVEVVFDFLAPVAAINEVINHAAIDRAGSVERVERRQVFQAIGLQPAADVFHAVGFKLEDRFGLAVAEELQRRPVVERNLCEVERLGSLALDGLQGVVDDRQRRQRQEVHLQHAGLFQIAHGVLRGDFVARRFRHRHQLIKRFRRNHHARRMHRRMARAAFQPLGDFDHLFDARVGLYRALQIGVLLDGVFD